MRWRLAVLIALLLLNACGDSPPPIDVVKNECLSDVNCVGKGVSCDLATQQCVRQQTLEPYRVLLQVQAESTLELRDAGVTLADQATFELGILEGGVQNKVLELPGAERLVGSVSGMVDGKMSLLESEVTLVPQSGDALVRSTVVNTSKDNRSLNDAGAPMQVDTLLNPQFEYDVRVQPLLSSSKQLPPLRQEAHDNPLQITYGEVVSRTAKLSSFSLTSWAGHRVRLEGEDGQVLSSTIEVGDEGQFTLYAVPDVFDAPDKFKLAVGLDVLNSMELPRWQVKLALGGTRFEQGAATITLPNVPGMVRVLSHVEDDQSVGLPFANLDFVSDFPLPDGTAAVGESDWCRLRSGEVTQTLHCSARLSTTTNEDGYYDIDLIPGTYRLFVTPNGQPTDALHPGTHQEDVTISRQPDDAPQRPQYVSVRPARRYLGTLLSPDGRPLPNVTVNARALALNRPETGELGEYNRSTTALSDSRGRFSTFTDVGAYDLSFEPPAASNFAWVVCINRVIKADERRSTSVSLRPIQPSAPVYIAGTVEHRGVLIPNAHIEAFAIAKDLDGKPRTVLVGRATSDAQGAYRLAMPPRGGETECPPPRE